LLLYVKNIPEGNPAMNPGILFKQYIFYSRRWIKILTLF